MAARQRSRAEFRLIINHSAAGALIGFNGATMKQLAEKTGVYMTIHKFKCPEKKVAEAIDHRVVTISYNIYEDQPDGGQTALFQALQLISEILKNEKDKELSLLQYPKTVVTNDYGFSLIISRFAASQLLVDQGKLLKRIQSEDCFVRLRQQLSQCDDQLMTIRGNLLSVCNAVLYLLPWLTQPHVPSTAGITYQQYSPTMPVDDKDVQVLKTLRVPTSQIGPILGKGGRRIREIKKVTSCNVHLPIETLQASEVPFEQDKLVEVIIRGPSKNISGALSMIYFSIYNTQRQREGYNQNHLIPIIHGQRFIEPRYQSKAKKKQVNGTLRRSNNTHNNNNITQFQQGPMMLPPPPPPLPLEHSGQYQQQMHQPPQPPQQYHQQHHQQHGRQQQMMIQNHQHQQQ